MGKILVTAIGSAAATAVIESLHKIGWELTGTDIYPKEWLVNSWRVERFVQVPVAAEEEKYISKLLSLCEEEAVEYIIPLTDIEIDVINEHRSVFEEQKITVCISEKSVVRCCRNKRLTAKKIAGKTQCNIIPEWDGGEEAGHLPVPAVCKPLNGRSSQGKHYFENRDELECFVKNIKRDEYLIQPYIPGEIIVADVLRDKDSGFCVATARKELLRSTNGLGTAVQVFNDRKLEVMCMELAQILDIHGCVNFEFIISEREYYFLECNPRFSGGIAFSIMSGYDFVGNTLKCFVRGVKPEKIGVLKEQIIVRQYGEYIRGIREVH